MISSPLTASYIDTHCSRLSVTMHTMYEAVKNKLLKRHQHHQQQTRHNQYPDRSALCCSIVHINCTSPLQFSLRPHVITHDLQVATPDNKYTWWVAYITGGHSWQVSTPDKWYTWQLDTPDRWYTWQVAYITSGHSWQVSTPDKWYTWQLDTPDRWYTWQVAYLTSGHSWQVGTPDRWYTWQVAYLTSGHSWQVGTPDRWALTAGGQVNGQCQTALRDWAPASNVMQIQLFYCN